MTSTDLVRLVSVLAVLIPFLAGLVLAHIDRKRNAP